MIRKGSAVEREAQFTGEREELVRSSGLVVLEVVDSRPGLLADDPADLGVGRDPKRGGAVWTRHPLGLITVLDGLDGRPRGLGPRYGPSPALSTAGSASAQSGPVGRAMSQGHPPPTGRPVFRRPTWPRCPWR